MNAWTSKELKKIAAADELEIAPLRRDGTLRNPVTIWIVRLGDDLYVRSYKGRGGSWFRAALVCHEGRIRAGGIEKDVTFMEENDRGIDDQIDAAYRTKYRSYGARFVNPMLGSEARAATIKLVPRSTSLRSLSKRLPNLPRLYFASGDRFTGDVPPHNPPFGPGNRQSACDDTRLYSFPHTSGRKAVLPVLSLLSVTLPPGSKAAGSAPTSPGRSERGCLIPPEESSRCRHWPVASVSPYLPNWLWYRLPCWPGRALVGRRRWS